MFGKEDLVNQAAETNIAQEVSVPTEWGCTLSIDLRGGPEFSKLEAMQEVLDGLNAFREESLLVIKDFRIDRLVNDYPVRDLE